jgi:hypothetical protein
VLYLSTVKNSHGIKYSFSVIFFAVLIGFISCKKDTKDVDGDVQSVVDNSICEQEFMQIQPNVNNLAINTKGTGAKKVMAGANVGGTCDTLKYLYGDTVNFSSANPPVFEFDYGTCSLGAFDGHTRTGKLNIRLIGKIKTAGSKTIIKMSNYKINGNITYSCDSMVVTTTTVTLSQYSFNVQVINGVCTGSGWELKYSCNKNVTINLNNPGGSDDVLMITGTANGTNRHGKNYDVVLNQITKHANCKWISAGTLEITPEGLGTRTVNYGEDDVCDNNATYSLNGQTIAFEMK